MDAYEELIGADYMEHNVHHPGVGVTRFGSSSSRSNNEMIYVAHTVSPIATVATITSATTCILFSRAVSVIKQHDERVDLGLTPVGKNKGLQIKTLLFMYLFMYLFKKNPYFNNVTGHMEYLEKVYAARLKKVVEERRQKRRNRVVNFETDDGQQEEESEQTF